jgi:uncharacterized membrane protein
MGLFKYIVIGIMLISIGLSLDVRMPQNITLSEGEVKDIQINLTNSLANSNIIGVSAYSGNFTMPPVLSSYIIDMNRYSSTNMTATINSKDTKPGDYTVTFLFASTQEDIVYSRVLNVHIQQTIEIVPAYSYIRATQGDFVTLKFTVYNYGKSSRSIIVDPESFPEDFNAEYPEPFYLSAGESKTIKVKITVPLDYHSGVYSHKITVLSGEVKADSGSFDLSVLKRSEFKNVVNIAAVELGGYIGDNGERGYNLMLRVDNRKDELITGIEIAGFPLGWNVSGDTPFYIDANSVKDINIRVIPRDFDEHKLDILLVKDSINLANTTLTFSGTKAGLVGAYFFGGSLTVGLLIVVLLALAFLYIRQRNMQADETEKSERLDYLKNLVDEVKKK